MAIDVARIRRRLPEPPADGNPAMEAPQTPAPDLPRPAPARAPATPPEARLLDGRSLRATGRTVQMNLKVSPETKARFLALAAARGVLMAELLEEAVVLLERDSR